MTKEEAGKGQETVHTCTLMQKAMSQIVTIVRIRWDCHTILSKRPIMVYSGSKIQESMQITCTQTNTHSGLILPH